MSGIFINSDAWNFWFAKPDAMSAAGIRQDVDFYAERGGVEAVFYNMNFQRAVYDSKVFTPIWKDCEVDAAGDLLLRGKKTDGSYRDLVVNPQLLRQNVPDFMQVRYDHCHARGIEMWHSITPMNTRKEHV